MSPSRLEKSTRDIAKQKSDVSETSDFLISRLPRVSGLREPKTFHNPDIAILNAEIRHQ